MVANLSARVAQMSALVLHVNPDATPDQVRTALEDLAGHEAVDMLGVGPYTIPADPYTARAVAAGRFLTSPRTVRSHALQAFLAADYKLPEIDRMVTPAREDELAYQPAMIA